MPGFNPLSTLRAIEPFVYLATPYTHYPHGRQAAFAEAARIAGWLLEQGVRVFCPITHTVPVAEHANIDPTDLAIWIPLDKVFLDLAGGLCIAMMDGWKTSAGVTAEVTHFQRTTLLEHRRHRPLVFLPWPIDHAQ